MANQTGCLFKELSATGVGINDVRVVLEEAKNTLTLTGKCVAYKSKSLLRILCRQTILFLDEVHRFNRAQQVRVL